MRGKIAVLLRELSKEVCLKRCNPKPSECLSCSVRSIIIRLMEEL